MRITPAFLLAALAAGSALSVGCGDTGGASAGSAGSGGAGSGGFGVGSAGTGGSGMGGAGMGGSGTGGAGMGGAGMGGAGVGGSGTGGAPFCAPFSTMPCYSGPANTQNVGVCKAGTQTCSADGSMFGPCVGQVLPGQETCATPGDEDCDGAVNEGCAALTCSLYQENFDDGNAGAVTAGVYKLDWCDEYLPLAMNTPLCMSGRTLRTNESSIDPTIWVYKASASCSQVKLSYTYYQFALAGVSVTYQQSNDALQVCEKSGVFTSVASHVALQACTAQTVTIPFGNSKGVYIRLEHGAGQNALWIDNLSIELLGCDC